MMRVGWQRRTRRSNKAHTSEIARELLSLGRVLDWRWGGMVEADGPGIAREGNEGSVEGAGDIIEGDLHGRDVGGIALS